MDKDNIIKRYIRLGSPKYLSCDQICQIAGKKYLDDDVKSELRSIFSSGSTDIGKKIYKALADMDTCMDFNCGNDKCDVIDLPKTYLSKGSYGLVFVSNGKVIKQTELKYENLLEASVGLSVKSHYILNYDEVLPKCDKNVYIFQTT
jgi:hypothetical protein